LRLQQSIHPSAPAAEEEGGVGAAPLFSRLAPNVAERTTMGVFPVHRLKEEVKMSATATVMVVAVLVFIEGLIGLWSMLSGLTQLRFVFQLEVLGLIGGPLLLMGSRLGYWYSLINLTASAIFCTAYFALFAFIDWLKFWNAGLAMGSVDFSMPMLFLAITVLLLFLLRVLRGAEVQSKFGLLPPPKPFHGHDSLSRG
jgi:hypothetical protein